jgi:predicted DCC family thiol-disulfide oxidoreductase YuxK
MLRVFYDGHCALCHGAVKFLLARDPDGGRFRFAPLEGETFARLVPAATRAGLPDSVVVLTGDGALLSRSAGVIALLVELGGGWRVLAGALRRVPRPLRDGTYDLVARVRKRLFAEPPDVCPMLPPELRARFEG